MRTFIQIQQPDISGDGSEYTAYARSTEDPEDTDDWYEIRWDVIFDVDAGMYLNLEDESEMCDWNKYTVHELATGRLIENAVVINLF